MKFIATTDNTNSCSTRGFHFMDKPFPHYYAYGTAYDYKVYAVRGFDPDKPAKFIITKKGTDLLVNDPDGTAALVHLTGGFRGGLWCMYSYKADIITPCYSDKHCNCSVSFPIRETWGDDWWVYVSLTGRGRAFEYLIMEDGLHKFDSVSDMLAWMDYEDVVLEPADTKWEKKCVGRSTYVLNPVPVNYDGDGDKFFSEL